MAATNNDAVNYMALELIEQIGDYVERELQEFHNISTSANAFRNAIRQHARSSASQQIPVGVEDLYRVYTDEYTATVISQFTNVSARPHYTPVPLATVMRNVWISLAGAVTRDAAQANPRLFLPVQAGVQMSERWELTAHERELLLNCTIRDQLKRSIRRGPPPPRSTIAATVTTTSAAAAADTSATEKSVTILGAQQVHEEDDDDGGDDDGMEIEEEEEEDEDEDGGEEKSPSDVLGSIDDAIERDEALASNAREVNGRVYAAPHYLDRDRLEQEQHQDHQRRPEDLVVVGEEHHQQPQRQPTQRPRWRSIPRTTEKPQQYQPPPNSVRRWRSARAGGPIRSRASASSTKQSSAEFQRQLLKDLTG